MSDLTYGQLDAALRSLGFATRVVEPNNWEYRHTETGAVIFLPIFPADKRVLSRHHTAVGIVLEGYGIADAADLAGKIHEAS
jgi:hypothetical protein